MKKAILFIALAATTLMLFAKPKIKVERPDMDKIKKEVTDPKSRYYYPALMKRYEKNDTSSLNLDDYRHLYFGMVFQEDFNPYRDSPFDHKIEEYYYKPEHTRHELDSIEHYATLALHDDPFDLNQMNYLIYALRKKGKTNMANIWQYRLNHLIAAILSTGTGKDKNNAWVIIDPKHEYNILNFQNAMVDEAEFIEPYYDFISAEDESSSKKPNKKRKGYYFDVRYVLEVYNTKFPPESSEE